MYPVSIRSRIARRFFVLACICLALCAAAWQSAHAESGKDVLAPQWIHMPAGARATYIGIHGGTVPVSLLTSRDGTHMVALVGQTGNDFLRTLKVGPGTRGALLPTSSGTLSSLDDEGNMELAHLHLQTAATPAASFRHTVNATLLKAGTAIGAMPVVYATGHSFASLNQLYTDSLLFGIAENSPLLEGVVKAPRKPAKEVRTAKRQTLVRGSSPPIN